MAFDPKEPLAEDVIIRLQNWETVIHDTLVYHAIARNEAGAVFDESKWVQHRLGKTRIDHAITKGMIGAAIVSFCQIMGKGDGGDNIASNSKSKVVANIREYLFGVSDASNGWNKGRTREIVEEQILPQRNHFLAHFSGQEAKISVREMSNDGSVSRRPRGSWSGRWPNPWYRSGAFPEFEDAAGAIAKELRRIVSDQTATKGRKP